MGEANRTKDDPEFKDFPEIEDFVETENSSEKKKNSFTKEYHDPNPWEVSDVTAFLYYCCPECDDRIAFEDAFIQHAILHHERVSTATHGCKSLTIPALV